MKARFHLVSILAATLFAVGCQTSHDPVPLAGPLPAPPPPPPASAPFPSAPPASSVASVTVRSGQLPPVPAMDRVRAVLVVRDTSGSADPTALAALRDWFQSAFASGRFAVVVPQDAVTELPEAAALRLAEQLGGVILLDATVTSARVRHVGGTDSGEQAVIDLAVFAKTVPSGELLAASGAVEARSIIVSSAINFEKNEENIWWDVAKGAAFAAAPALDAAYVAARPNPKVPVPAPVRVLFASNVPGANVKIDGVSRGTIGVDPLPVAVSPGLHDVEVSYHGMVSFKDHAILQDGTAFVVQLAMTDKAAFRAKQDAYFGTILDRVQKSGLTDDAVRDLVAKGYAKYLSSSHTRLEGMLQSLQIGGDAPSLGLDNGSSGKDADMPSTADILKQAESMLKTNDASADDASVE